MKTDETTKIRKNRFLVTGLFCFMVVLSLIAGLWPFDFFPINGAVLDGTGLVFTSRGVAHACSDELLFPSGDMTLEFSVLPGDAPIGVAGEIVSIYDERELLLGVFQWRESLVVHSGLREYETGAESVLRNGKRTVMTVTAGKKGIWIYADGNRVGGTVEPFYGPEKARCFVLGTLPEGIRPWKGRIYSLSILSRQLSDREISSVTEQLDMAATYLFEGVRSPVENLSGKSLDIEVPERFSAAKKELLAPIPGFSKLKASFDDVIINFVGFIPLGFLFYLLPFGRSGFVKILAAVLTGFMLSFGIEAAQVFIPTRFSHLSDLLLNTIGAGTGAVAAFLLERRKTVQ